MIAAWPNKITAGSSTDHVSAFYDFLPTACEIIDVEVPGDVDGISFLPTLLNRKQIKHEYLYWEFPEYGGQQALRMGRWKAIRKNLKNGNTEIDLYDLKNDLQEQINVAADHPTLIKKIDSIFISCHTPAKIERFKMVALGDVLNKN